MLHRLIDTLAIPYPRKRLARWWAARGIPRRSLSILQELEHAPDAFTQGLVHRDGLLYESTGKLGASTLRQLDPNTGALMRTVAVDGHWAEGIAILGARLYQITYQCGRCIVYRLPDLMRVEELEFEGEGWGLTSNDASLIMSNGSDEIRFYSERMTLERTLRVRIRGRSLDMVNDLTWTGRHLVANVLHDPNLYAISPSSGRVEYIMDASGLITRSNRLSADDVLNGIAYVVERDTFFLTGKHWPKLFEISNPLSVRDDSSQHA
jgi:glutamine cyclotransferase